MRQAASQYVRWLRRFAGRSLPHAEHFFGCFSSLIFTPPLYLKSVTDQALFFDEKRRTRELVTDSLFTELALKEPALPC
jgi:hypothetical protein